MYRSDLLKNDLMQLFENWLLQSCAEPDTVHLVQPVSSKEITVTLSAIGYHKPVGEDGHSVGVQQHAL